MKKLGIYIHIPFCKSKCHYCDFYSIDRGDSYYDKYFETLQKQIRSYENEFDNYIIDTIYIGGGTPSYVPPKYIKKTIRTIQNYNLDKKISTTIEINPGTINEDKILSYKESGINRISVGLQSLDDKILKSIGRVHLSKEFYDTYYLLKKYNIKDISVDIMFSLPNQTLDILKDTVKKIVKLDIEGISAYSLIIEEGTKIYQNYENGIYKKTDDILDRKMYWYIVDELKKNGFNQYEISNFAKEGYKSEHNMKYWNMDEYLGFGVGAHSYFEGKRFSGADTIDQYIENPLKKYNVEIIDRERKINEHMMLGFRKTEGISEEEFFASYGVEVGKVFKLEIKKLIKMGLVVKKDRRYFLSRKGMDFANLVFMEFV